MTDKIDRTHGSTGNKPPDGKEFSDGERPDDEHFDWWWYTVTERINSIVGEITAITNGTTSVGAADTAVDAENVTATYKQNDIDSNGDGVVDQAELANETVTFQTATSYPSNPEDGEVVFRTDKT